MTESNNFKKENVKNKDEFKCEICSLGCNSQKQLDIHVMSRKHEKKLCDKDDLLFPPKAIRRDKALNMNINVYKYFFNEPLRAREDLKKYDKFGYFCKTCNKPMTGQLQLIMHVTSESHLSQNPNEYEFMQSEFRKSLFFYLFDSHLRYKSENK